MPNNAPTLNHAERVFAMAAKIRANEAEAAECVRELEQCGFSIALVLMSETPEAEPLREAARLVARAAGVWT